MRDSKVSSRIQIAHFIYNYIEHEVKRKQKLTGGADLLTPSHAPDQTRRRTVLLV